MFAFISVFDIIKLKKKYNKKNNKSISNKESRVGSVWMHSVIMKQGLVVLDKMSQFEYVYLLIVKLYPKTVSVSHWELVWLCILNPSKI